MINISGVKNHFDNYYNFRIFYVIKMVIFHSGRFSYKRVDKIFFGSELYFLGSNYYIFMILKDPSQLLAKILTGQNHSMMSLYDAEVSSL